MSFALSGPGWRSTSALMGAILVVGTTAWLLRPEPVAVFTFPTSDGISMLHYSCTLAESEAATLALTEQAHAAFEAELPQAIEKGVSEVYVAMTTQSIPDLESEGSDDKSGARPNRWNRAAFWLRRQPRWAVGNLMSGYVPATSPAVRPDLLSPD